MTQKCILNERKKGGCATCLPNCAHFISLNGLSGTGGRIGAANVPRDYRQLTLKNAPAREEQAKIYASLAKYVATFERQFDTGNERVKSLYLYSVSPGTGKSTTASALVNEWLIAHYLGSLKRGIQPQQVPAYYLDVNELQTRYNLATMTDDKAELDDIKRLMRKCMDVPFLVCDDIGLRSATESFKSIVHAIINARTTESAPTIYTSNVSIGELAGIYDARLQDRIADQCLNLAFSGESKRGKR